MTKVCFSNWNIGQFSSNMFTSIVNTFLLNSVGFCLRDQPAFKLLQTTETGVTHFYHSLCSTVCQLSMSSV